MASAAYKVTNWKEYNRALEKRGDITVWIDTKATKNWFASGDLNDGKEGAPFKYSDSAIICALTIRSVFGLALRQTVGFMQSLLKLMQLDLPMPKRSTLSRRAAELDVRLPAKGRSTHIVIDSTGLKIYGEGEWKTRQHGYSKRRTWRKLHLSIDANTQQVLAFDLTENKVHDSKVLPLLLKNEKSAKTVHGDGAYDTRESYNAIADIGAVPLIPPRKGARISKHGNSHGARLPRDENIRAIRKNGKAKWKMDSGYHKRSLAETGMHRFKAIFSGSLRSRAIAAQKAEAGIKIMAMNRMTQLGMPKTKIVRSS
jgi:hypothetical protein